MFQMQGVNALADPAKALEEYRNPDALVDIAIEGKLGLTDFLAREKMIPARDSVKSDYDKVIPDDWGNVRAVFKNLLSGGEQGGNTDIFMPVLPRITYKYVYDNRVMKVVADVDSESGRTRLLIFNVKGGWWLQAEIVLGVNDSGVPEVFSIRHWFRIFCELYGLWDDEYPFGDERFMKYTEPRCGYYDYLFDKTQDYMNNTDMVSQYEKFALAWANDYLALAAYMNHCIDIETEKRLKGQREAVDGFFGQEDGRSRAEVVHGKTAKREKGVVRIGNICIHAGANTGTKRHKVIRRKCLCWGVRGHKRYYKDGKVVYIKPYKKGRDRLKGEEEAKTYLLFGEREG